MTQTTAPFATITSKLGVHVATTRHGTLRAAEMAARKAIKTGSADSAAVYDDERTQPVSVFGAGR